MIAQQRSIPLRLHLRFFAVCTGLLLVLLTGPNPDLSPAPTAAQDDAPAEFVGQLGGPSMAVAIRDETLYLGVGPRVAVFDLGDPAAPVWEPSGLLLDGLVLDMVLGTDHLFVATEPSRIAAISIGEDGSLALEARIEIPGSGIRDLAVQDDWLFVAVALGGVLPVDISDPANPSPMDALDASLGGKRIAVNQDHVRLLDEDGRLSLIDRGARGVLSISRTLEIEAAEIALAGDRLALVHLDQTLRTYDLSDFETASPLAEAELGTAASSMAWDGDRLYVGTLGGGIEVFDTAGTSGLTPIAAHAAPGNAAGMRVEHLALLDGAVFAAARTGPILPRAPLLHGAGALLHNPVDGILQQLRIPSTLIDEVEITGRTAWVLEGFSATEQHLTPVDLADPAALRAKPELPLDAGTRVLAMAGSADTLYVRVNQGLLVVDGATALLKHKGFEPRGSGEGPMRLWHELLVIASGTDLSVFDVSGPHEPRRLGEYLRLPAEAVGMEISPDGVAYIAFEEGWTLVSLRDPGRPQIVRGSAEGRTDQLTGDGTRMYSLHGDLLRMLEPNALRPPLERWTHDFGAAHGIRRIAASGARLYGLSSEARIYALDTSGPRAPRALRTIPRPSFVFFGLTIAEGEGDLAVDGSDLLAAIPGAGLLRYRADDALSPGDRGGLEHSVFLPRVMRGFRAPVEPSRRVLEPLGSWRNLDDISSIGLAVDAGRAYLGLSDADGAYVAILDVSRPERPQLLGRSPALDGVIDAIAVEGGRAYVASAGRINALHVLEVSNPSAPQVLGRVGLNGRGWKAVARGGRVYLSRPRGIAPALRLDGAQPYTDARRLEISGIGRHEGLRGGTLPPDARRSDSEGPVEGITADSCSGRGVLCIIDALDPHAPRVIGGIDPGPEGDIAGFDLVGNRLVAADLQMGLRVFDVGNPAAPVELGRFDAGGGAQRWSPHDLSFDGRVATVVTRGGDEGFEGLWMVDLGDPSQPRELGSVGGMEGDGARVGGWFVRVSGETAFVRSSGSLLAFDIGEPAFPRLLDEHEMEITRGRIGLAVDADIAFTPSLHRLEVFRLIEP